MQFPDWNSLTNDERTRLVKMVSWYAWPPVIDLRDLFKDLDDVCKRHGLTTYERYNYSISVGHGTSSYEGIPPWKK